MMLYANVSQEAGLRVTRCTFAGEHGNVMPCGKGVLDLACAADLLRFDLCALSCSTYGVGHCHTGK